jgi:hypothetical protein
MYIQQGASAAFPLSSRVQAIFATLAHVVKIIRTDNNAAQSDSAAQSDDAPGSRLERHLRYDIGEIDHDPRRSGSLDSPSSHELQLWLNHYPR